MIDATSFTTIELFFLPHGKLTTKTDTSVILNVSIVIVDCWYIINPYRHMLSTARTE